MDSLNGTAWRRECAARSNIDHFQARWLADPDGAQPAFVARRRRMLSGTSVVA